MNELQSVTDIDEVIKYAERRAEGCHQMASSYHTDEGVYLPEETRLQYRAILWENIHEWLEELKELRKKQRPHGEWEKYGDKIEAYDIAGNKSWGQKRRCTNCGFIHTYIEDFGIYPTCPNCGANMWKEGEEK